MPPSCRWSAQPSFGKNPAMSSFYSMWYVITLDIGQVPHSSAWLALGKNLGRSIYQECPHPWCLLLVICLPLAPSPVPWLYFPLVLVVLGVELDLSPLLPQSWIKSASPARKWSVLVVRGAQNRGSSLNSLPPSWSLEVSLSIYVVPGAGGRLDRQSPCPHRRDRNAGANKWINKRISDGDKCQVESEIRWWNGKI